MKWDCASLERLLITTIQNQPGEFKKNTLLEKENIVSFSPAYKNFIPEDLEFWSQYGINRKTLDRYNVRSIYSCKFQKENGKEYNVYGGKAKPAFAYLFNRGKGIKNIYAKITCKISIQQENSLNHTFLVGNNFHKMENYVL